MEKINIAELLKDCPKGMELDCTMYDNCTYAGIEDVGYIDILINTPSGRIRLTKEGCYIRHDDNAKCVIFPKGKTTWEGFHKPFKDGDIVATATGRWIGITSGGEKSCFIPTYCVINGDGIFEAYLDKKIKWQFNRLASEEEKQKLFDAIKANGYKWNPETKTLEKLIEPKFKVGDKIKDKNNKIWFVVWVSDKHFSISLIPNAEGFFVLIEDQDEYELVPNKFDIATLKPFDRVLVRGNVGQKWIIDFFGYYRDDGTYQCMTFTKHQCIPYEVNQHLLGTTNDCDDFYKTWEK